MNGEIGEVTKVEAFTDRPLWPQGLAKPEMGKGKKYRTICTDCERHSRDRPLPYTGDVYHWCNMPNGEISPVTGEHSLKQIDCAEKNKTGDCRDYIRKRFW